MNNNFSLVSDIQSHNSRNSKGNFYLPQVNGFTSTTFYYNKAIKDWNCLPADVKIVKNNYTKPYNRSLI